MQHFGSSHVELTDSGTSALMLALRTAIARRPGAVCALPGYGCFDLATAALGAGARVVLYDLDPLTLAPDLDSLRAAVSDGAAAIVVVHLYGVPVPVDAIQSIADRAGALLVEDAAQGIGGSWAGRPLGASGAMGVLSFGRGKGVTGGGGGALLVRDPELVRGLALASAGQRGGGAIFAMKLAAQWLLARPSLYFVPAAIPWLGLGETPFHAPHEPMPIAAASARVLRHTWALAEPEAVVRRTNVATLRRAAPSCRGVPTPAHGGIAGWLRLPVLGPPQTSDERVHASALGIMPGYPLPLHRLEPLRPALVALPVLPGSEQLAGSLWTVPTHSRLSGADLAACARWMEERCTSA